MMLVHAKALAASEVYRMSKPEVTFPKNGAFTPEQLAAEDWLPVQPPYEPPLPSGDCADCPK